MPHTYLSLDLSLVPYDVQSNNHIFWKGVASNEQQPTRLLLDGYDDKRNLVHSEDMLKGWLYGVKDYQASLEALLSSAVEYTKTELEQERSKEGSIWYYEKDNIEYG